MTTPRMPDLVVELAPCTRPDVDLDPWLNPSKTTNTSSWRLELAACGGCPLAVMRACRIWLYASKLEFQGTIQGGWAAPAHRGPTRPPWDRNGDGYPWPDDLRKLQPSPYRRRKDAEAQKERQGTPWHRLSDAAKANAQARNRERLAALTPEERAKRQARANERKRQRRSKEKEAGG